MYVYINTNIAQHIITKYLPLRGCSLEKGKRLPINYVHGHGHGHRHRHTQHITL